MIFKDVLAFFRHTAMSIVENCYNTKTVEQKAMFTLCIVTVNLIFTLSKKNRQIIAKCEHEFGDTLSHRNYLPTLGTSIK